MIIDGITLYEAGAMPPGWEARISVQLGSVTSSRTSRLDELKGGEQYKGYDDLAADMKQQTEVALAQAAKALGANAVLVIRNPTWFRTGGDVTGHSYEISGNAFVLKD